ncbi:MAG: MarR family transcriptional regulator [Acidimicrobiales bacterium]
MPPIAKVDNQPSSQLIDSLVRTSFAVTAVLSQVAAAHDMSLTQLRAMAVLRDREPKMAELASFLGLDRSSVSGLIDRAVARGLVHRTTSNEDGRAIHVSLTPEGKRLGREGAHEIAGLVSPMLRSLSPQDQDRLRVLLEKFLG